MSNITIVALDEKNNPWMYDSISGARFGAYAIWLVMEREYLPKRSFSRLNSSYEAKEIWKLWERQDIPMARRVALLCTMEQGIVRKEEMPQLVEYFREFSDKIGVLADVADVIEEMMEDDDVAAVAWNWNDAVDSPWREDEDEPYDCDVGDNHFWVFDAIAEVDGKAAAN